MTAQKPVGTVLLKAQAAITTGTLVDINQTSNGHYRLIFEDGQTQIMPATWQVPFDLTVGLKIKAGYDNGRFVLQKL